MMNLSTLIAELESLEASRISGTEACIFAEVRKNAHETVVVANQDGLLHIALQLLRIADKGSEGAHFHLDESSIADSAETNVVFSFGKAPYA